jgi:peptidyl-Asp metalloendopeptidase
MRRLLFIAIFAGVLCGFAGAAVTQPLPVPSLPLFADADAASLRAAAVLPEQAGTIRTRIARLDPAAVSQLRGGTLTLNLFDDAALTATGGVRSDNTTRGTGSTLWLGSVSGVPYSDVILLTDAAGNIDLRVLTRGRNYFVQSLGGGIVRISEIDPSAGRYDASYQRTEDTVTVEPSEGEQHEAALNRASIRADDGTVIDVMAVYTPAAATLLGSEAAARLAIEAAVALSNVTYENGGVNFRIRLVHLARVDYTELGDASDLTRLRNTSDGHMDIVHKWRDQYAADLVALIPGTSVENRSYCGIANLPTVLPAPNSAFSITEALCINDITFVHELGHNMGKAHDHANGSFAVHPYAYGYQDQSEGPGDYGDWVTVMAYSDGGECPPNYIPGECPAIAYWSDNEATYNGKPLGNPGPNGEDNVQSLNETALSIANYRISADGGAVIPTPQPTLTPIPTPGEVGAQLPLNGGFEYDNDANGTPDGWRWASISGKRVCSGQRWSGSCALVLKPGAKLIQIVPLELTALGQGDMLTLSVYAFPKPNPAGCASARLKISYADTSAGVNGNGRDKFILPLPDAPVKQWQQTSGAITLDGQPTRVKLELEANGCVKSIRIDDVMIEADAAR